MAVSSTRSKTADASYVIDHCYNLNAENDLIDETNRDIRIGGLVGCGWQQAGKAAEELILRNSASVEITAGKCLSWYAGITGCCNEYIMRGNLNADGNVEILAEEVATLTASAFTRIRFWCSSEISPRANGSPPQCIA